MHEDPSPKEVLAALLQEVENFSATELYSLLYVARRLSVGRKQYGVLNPWDGHDWHSEWAEEAADAFVYASAEEMKRKGIDL